MESHALIQMLSFKWLHCRIHFIESKFRAIHFSIINRTVKKVFLSRGFSKGFHPRTQKSQPLCTSDRQCLTIIIFIILSFCSCLPPRSFQRCYSVWTLSEGKFKDRNPAPQQKQREQKETLPFTTKYHPAVHNLKPVLMNNWDLIRQQPLLR